ncbi:uncharacterized protein [Argopecten irradians]|uniref:uncharacterized protein isoform X2 n=1 Tax=Argopecten irradians TaxID=31199 RepID=UPI003714A008
MATGDVRSTFAPLMGGSRYQTKKFDTPYGLRPDVEKKEVITKQESDKLPKIILKDSTGQQLNTFTTLQEAIYRAELNVRKSRIGATALEWRLPHGPLPAKPDFSRVGPSMSTYRQKMNNLKKKNRVVSRSLPEYTRYKEVDVDDVAFVAESLNHLPHVPSLSFLRQEFLASPKRYFPIVHSILLHQKLLSETDRRDPEYTFPGFCFGCRQHMLCPGCDRTSKPHYHLDNLYKTTGGLTQARTLQDELKKHYGDNWRLTLPDLLVRKTSKVPSLTKEEMQLIEEELDRTLKSRSDQGQRTFLPPIATAIGQGQDGGKKKTGTASESVDTEDEGILADKQSFGYNEDDSSHDQDRGHQGSIGQSSDYDIDKDSDTEGRSGSRGRSRRRTYKGSGPRSHTTGSAVDFDDDDDRSGYTSSQRTERKGRLYKAPVAFKIKQRKRRLLKSQSPFTKERNLDVPTGPGFKLKQNAKATTKFVDFERKDSNWKEPSKFEIQKSEKDATKFWSPKTQKKKKQHEKRGRHPSPDSGLDSDKMAASKRGNDTSERLEGIAEDRQKNKSFPDADYYANEDDEILTFMSTIKADTEVTSKSSVVAGDQLTENSDHCNDPEEVSLSSQEAENQNTKLSADNEDLNVASEEEGKQPISISSQDPTLGLSQNISDFIHQNASSNINELEQNISASRLAQPLSPNLLSDVHSEQSNHSDAETTSRLTNDKSVPQESECLVSFNQNTLENVVTESENDFRSLDHDNASDSECTLNGQANYKQNTENISEVSELRDLVENSEFTSSSETNLDSSLDEGRQENTSATVTCDLSHGASRQEVTLDPDLHLHIQSFGESVRDEDQENTMPQTLVPEKPKPQLVSTPSSQRIATERPPPVKKEKVKKTRREVKDHEKKRLVNGDRTESNDFSQVQVDQEQESTLISTTEELPPLTNGHAESPELPPIEIPPLPEYVEEKKEVKVKENNRTLIKPLPKPKEAKLPPPPTLKGPKRTVPKTGPKKKSRVPSAEAPVTQEELNDMTDPLDFLTKYCIIHMDRLPFYERIFSNVVETQAPRYERARPLSPRTGMPLAESELPQWGKHELGMFRDLVVISRGQDPEKIGLSPPEQYLEKICYTLEILTDKRKDICASLGELESIKIKKLAERAKEVIKDIIKPNFTPKAPKKGKKKKKKKGQTEEPEAPPPRLTLNDITDEIIVSRIDEKTMKMLCKEADICQINLEMERCNEKLDHIEERMLHLDGEKNILGMYCMEVYFLEQLNNQKPVEFRRAQSALYNKIHPHPDVEMNVDELEGSLQIINNNLLSTKEFEYLFHVLNLPGRRKLNFKLFSIVAALSEKVTQMDPVVRKLINKMDYHALDHKMNRSKDLFALICDGEPTPRGNATASNLAVELTAGGLTPEHIKVVLSKFNREGSGYIDFMDFVMYIPLFIEIHQRIVQNPLDVKFTL